MTNNSIDLTQVKWDKEPQLNTVDLSKVQWDSEPKKDDESWWDKTKDAVSFAVNNPKKAAFLAVNEIRNQLNGTNIHPETAMMFGLKDTTSGLDPKKAKQEAIDHEAIGNTNPQTNAGWRGDNFFANTEKAKNLVSALDNTSPTTLLQKLFTGVTPEEKSKYENGIWKIAQSLGFDDAKIDEQTKNLYFSKAGEDYQVSGEFLDDAWGALKASSGEIASGVGGGIVGEAMYQIAKKSKNPLLKAVVAGSKFARPAMIAAGSAAGSSTGAVSDYLYNTYKTGGEVDTDTLINKAVESGMLSAAFDMAIPVAKAAAKPAINAATAVKEFALNENLTGAKQILKENGYSKADIDKITADISKYQTAKVAQDGVDAQRDALLSVAYQDPILHKHITSAVAEDPEKAKKLLDIVSSRAQNILEQGKEIDRDALKNSIKEYEARVSADFGDTIKLYEDLLPHYKFEVKNEIEGIVAKLKDGIGDTDIKSELDALLVRMGRTEDMGVGDMLKMRQDINSILRKPKVKRYDDIGALKTINETIDKSVDDAIDKQMIDDEVKASVKKQFSDINAEYAQMKELQDGYLYKKVFDENLPSENDFQKLLYKVSQTEIDGANRLIEKLNPQMQADMQASVINSVASKFIKNANGTKYVDWNNLSKALDGVKYKLDNEEVAEYVSNLKKMARLFRNDEMIVKAAQRAEGDTVHNNIATTITGKARMYGMSKLFETLMKYLPHKGGRYTAFEHHIRKALDKDIGTRELLLEVVTHKDAPKSLLSELKPIVTAYNAKVSVMLDEMAQKYKDGVRGNFVPHTMTTNAEVAQKELSYKPQVLTADKDGIVYDAKNQEIVDSYHGEKINPTKEPQIEEHPAQKVADETVQNETSALEQYRGIEGLYTKDFAEALAAKEPDGELAKQLDKIVSGEVDETAAKAYLDAIEPYTPAELHKLRKEYKEEIKVSPAQKVSAKEINKDEAKELSEALYFADNTVYKEFGKKQGTLDRLFGDIAEGKDLTPEQKALYADVEGYVKESGVLEKYRAKKAATEGSSTATPDDIGEYLAKGAEEREAVEAEARRINEIVRGHLVRMDDADIRDTLEGMQVFAKIKSPEEVALDEITPKWVSVVKQRADGYYVNYKNKEMDKLERIHNDALERLTELQDRLYAHDTQAKALADTKAIDKVQNEIAKLKAVEWASNGALKATGGSGLLGGMANGLEYDNEGNITGINAEKFLIGLVGGALAGAIVSGKAGQKAIEIAAKKLEPLKELAINEGNTLAAMVYGKLKNTFFEVTPTQKIVNFVRQSITSKDPANIKLELSIVSDETAKFVKEAFGLDIQGYTRKLDNYSIRHIFKQHGNAKAEAARGQIAVTVEDLAKYNDITENYDKIAYAGKTKQGRDTIIYQKRYGDVIYLVEEARDKRRELSPVTMWKMKETTPDASGYQWQPAPRSNAQSVSSHAEILQQDDAKSQALKAALPIALGATASSDEDGNMGMLAGVGGVMAFRGAKTLPKGFFSRLESVAEEKLPNRFGESTAIAILKKNGVKDEEIAWANVANGLSVLKDQKGLISKDDFAEWVKLNRVQLSETKNIPAKYEAYKLPQTQNYREILVSAPDMTKGYKNGHWQDPKTIMHIRAGDVDIDGQKTLMIEEIQSDLHQAARQGKNTPSAPLSKTWYQYGLKRMMQEAVDGDYGRIAWTTADTQNKRNALSTIADEVIYNEKSGVVAAKRNGVEIMFKRGVTTDGLPSVIGKDLTQKMLDIEANAGGGRKLTGDELKVGGDGMEGFYDKILPDFARKYLRQYESALETKTLDDGTKVWSFEVTPKMKETISKNGQPLYAIAPIAAITASTDEKDKDPAKAFTDKWKSDFGLKDKADSLKEKMKKLLARMDG